MVVLKPQRDSFSMRMALTPLLKAKVDELFLKWLSEKQTQTIVRDDLRRILQGQTPIPRQTSPNNRAVSPPAPTSSPTPHRSPRSPRCRKNSSKSPPRSPRANTTADSSLKNGLKNEKFYLNDRKILAGCAAHLPRFYFPRGKPVDPKINELILQKVKKVFGTFPNGKVAKENFGVITKACELPLYWKEPLFSSAGGHTNGFVSCATFIGLWKRIIQSCHDDASRFMRLMTRHSRNYLTPEDFVPIIQDIVDTHPGLTFLQEAPEFHTRYIHTVIARIFYNVNCSWTGKITLSELRKSNFLRVLASLEEEEDINQVTDYFSYEHFYVIYCKFWELDTDHDLLIDEKDLSKHNNHAISSQMIKRIFSGCVTRGDVGHDGKMTYPEFVWFLLSEEDKRHPRSIEYWFRCMDLDGDGVISMYELEYFYLEQMEKMESLGIETMTLEDVMCSMMDLVKPKIPGKIYLSDLKHNKLTPVFFNTFFNLEKYLEYEQRDPFSQVRDPDEPEQSDWEKYAQDEYDLLVAEEGGNEEGQYEDDFEDEELDEEDLHVLKADLGMDERQPDSFTMLGGLSNDDDDEDDFY